MTVHDWSWVWKTLIFSTAVAVLAYIIPGMILRAIRDFKRKYGKGEADVEEP